MDRNQSFDTIWREKFNPKLVQITQNMYLEYLPRVDVIPWSVYDERVLEIDLGFQEKIGDALRNIKIIIAHVPPHSISISMRQLLKQIPSIVSGSQDVLRIFTGHRWIKSVPVDQVLIRYCKTIQSILLERLLLFEDLYSILPIENVDGWADLSYQAQHGFTYDFSRGAKTDALIDLLRMAIGMSKSTVVFVRNIPVCEAISSIISKKDIQTEVIHGNIEESLRRARLDKFKKGDARVLILSRQLYGRGFDIPQADNAIFYSPKENEQTMWQEMLRIRGTVRKPKEVYVLYYSWTAEASKMVRLIQGMLRTNAFWIGDRYSWSYSEDEDVKDKNTTTTRVSSSNEENNHNSITRKFITTIIKKYKTLFMLNTSQINKAVDDIAQQVGFVRLWPNELIRVLIFDLAATIKQTPPSREITTKMIKREFAKVLHPDKHPNAVGTEKQFWQELFVALEISKV